MGINGLMRLISDQVPGAVKEDQLKNYFGRKLAVDASISIVQFLVVVGRVGEQVGQRASGSPAMPARCMAVDATIALPSLPPDFPRR